jgi:hypothetical protein
MHIPLLFRTRTIADPPSVLRSLLQRGVSKSSRFRLLTYSRAGECHARTLRLFGWSLDETPSLWFMAPRQSQVAFSLHSGAEAMLEIGDPKVGQLIRVAGHARLVPTVHEPAYLHSSVRSASLKIVSDPLDFVFLRVELRSPGEAQAPMHLEHLAAA